MTVEGQSAFNKLYALLCGCTYECVECVVCMLYISICTTYVIMHVIYVWYMRFVYMWVECAVCMLCIYIYLCAICVWLCAWCICLMYVLGRHVCVCGECTCIYVQIQMPMHVWRARGHGSTLSFSPVFQQVPGSWNVGWCGIQQAPVVLLSLLPIAQASKCLKTRLAFHMVLATQTLVLMLLQQMLYPVTHWASSPPPAFVKLYMFSWLEYIYINILFCEELKRTWRIPVENESS